MPQDKYNVSGAMFDIKPVNESGRIDFAKIEDIKATIDLSVFREETKKVVSVPMPKAKKISKKKNTESPAEINEPIGNDFGGSDVVDSTQPVVELASEPTPLLQLESHLNSKLDIEAELSRVGGELVGWSFKSKPKYKNIVPRVRYVSESVPEIKVSKNTEEVEYSRILEHLTRPVKLFGDEVVPVDSEVKDEADSITLAVLGNSLSDYKAKEVDFWFNNLKKPEKKSFKKNFLSGVFSKLNSGKKYLWLIVGFTAILGAGYFSGYGLNVKNDLIRESNSAVVSLENAKENLKSLDFISASDNFSQAYEEFSKAGDSLNFLGANIGSLIADLPGAGKLKSANNLVKAGKFIASAGQSMSDAMAALSKTGLILNPQNKNGSSMGKIVANFQEALNLSKDDIGKARALLADVDEGDIPEDKLSSFQDFKSKLPVFEDLVAQAGDYANFLKDLIGNRDARTYLILFQNQAELRPTGGFPGTYGLITFKDGRLEDFRVDDVYNLDGQLKEHIIPPKQLQHITPTWGMRDAGWFIDFPASAKKAESFFEKESGAKVDGVITLSPQMVADIIDVIGPIELPDYKLKIDGKNFATVIQDEVEYGANRTQPKKIVMDLAPKLLEKIYSADQGNWYKIFNILVDGMAQKDILMYFNDSILENFSSNKGFSGAIQDIPGSDYLSVNFSNVKGSKTDTVTDSSIKVDTVISSDSLKHKITITRKHNGGSMDYGFYNKQNPAYVRVLVPDGSTLLNISGNSEPDFKPLMNYSGSDFKKDRDLVKLEETAQDAGNGATVYKESGKTEFGFWMITDPGKTKTVEIEYQVPGELIGKNYQLYIQKQPGLKISNFEFSLKSDFEIEQSSPKFSRIGDSYTLNEGLDGDLPIKINFK